MCVGSGLILFWFYFEFVDCVSCLYVLVGAAKSKVGWALPCRWLAMAGVASNRIHTKQHMETQPNHMNIQGLIMQTTAEVSGWG